jgi:hypothetical protein
VDGIRRDTAKREYKGRGLILLRDKRNILVFPSTGSSINQKA